MTQITSQPPSIALTVRRTCHCIRRLSQVEARDGDFPTPKMNSPTRWAEPRCFPVSFASWGWVFISQMTTGSCDGSCEAVTVLLCAEPHCLHEVHVNFMVGAAQVNFALRASLGMSPHYIHQLQSLASRRRALQRSLSRGSTTFPSVWSMRISIRSSCRTCKPLDKRSATAFDFVLM